MGVLLVMMIGWRSLLICFISGTAAYTRHGNLENKPGEH